MLDSEWNMLGYDHTHLGLGYVGFSWIMFDLSGTCWDMTLLDLGWKMLVQMGKCWI